MSVAVDWTNQTFLNSKLVIGFTNRKNVFLFVFV